MKKQFTVGALLAAGVAICGMLFAQAAASTKDGVYTTAQAEQGHAIYTAQCAMCHGDKLQGAGQNPALAGNSFLQNWQGQTLNDLSTQIQSTMPATKPGSLKPEEVAQLIAYILSENKYPVGANEVPHTADALKAIHFDLPAGAAQ